MFEYYQNQFQGKLTQEDFSKLKVYAINDLLKVVDKHVPFFNKSKINFENELFYRPVCFQIDFLSEVGISNIVANKAVTEIKTSTFTINYDDASTKIGNTRVSNYAYNELLSILRQERLTYTLIN